MFISWRLITLQYFSGFCHDSCQLMGVNRSQSSKSLAFLHVDRVINSIRLHALVLHGFLSLLLCFPCLEPPSSLTSQVRPNRTSSLRLMVLSDKNEWLSCLCLFCFVFLSMSVIALLSRCVIYLFKYFLSLK